MSLIGFTGENPPYFVGTGSRQSIANANILMPIAENIVSQNDIIKTSNTRLTINTQGTYVLKFFLFVSSNVGSAGSGNIQTGVNGAFTTLSTAAINAINIKSGKYTIVYTLNKGDYVEVRSNLTVSPTQHIIMLGNNGINSTFSIRKVY